MKTKTKIFTLAIACFCFASCTKKVKVEVSEIEGPLAGAFTATPGEYVVQKDDDGNEFIVVDVTRTNETLPFTSENISVYGQDAKNVYFLAGFGYKADDASPNSPTKASNNVCPVEQQLEILKLPTGGSGKLPILLVEGIPASIKLTSELQIENTGEFSLNGSIGQYGTKNFTMEVNVAKETVTGKYQYKTSPAGAFLNLNGKILSSKCSDNKYSYTLRINESSNHRSWSGTFNGTLTLKRDSNTTPYYYEFVGTFESHQFIVYDYDLKSDPITE